MNITKKEMTAAFTEWRQQVVNTPEDFISDKEKAELSFEEYGERSMNFFIKLVKEARKA
jgi:hypothetical protein